MRVAVFSRTPLAAAPWELYRALKKYTILDVSLINQTHRYVDGRVFPHHLLWASNNGQARRALVNADVWHIHNYFVGELRSLKKNQRVVAQFHSVPRLGNWRALLDFADIAYTIAQPLQQSEYKLPGLPNIVDPDEYMPIVRSQKIKIAFAPTNKSPVGNMASKGYREVKAILNDVATKRDVEIVWIEGREYYDNLHLKRESHILIDDVVTGNWHRTSLEGACFGCAILNRVQKVPFVHASLKTLEEKLLWLIDNPAILRDFQERARLWVLQDWHAMDRVQEYVKAYERAAR